MKRSLLILPAVLAAGAVAVPALAATKTITVGDNYFVRASGVPTVTVKKGSTVKWAFRGNAPHNVTVIKGPTSFRSSTMTSGAFAKKVTRRGTYTIICTIHGASDQKMVLKVK